MSHSILLTRCAQVLLSVLPKNTLSILRKKFRSLKQFIRYPSPSQRVWIGCGCFTDIKHVNGIHVEKRFGKMTKSCNMEGILIWESNDGVTKSNIWRIKGWINEVLL